MLEITFKNNLAYLFQNHIFHMVFNNIQFHIFVF